MSDTTTIATIGTAAVVTFNEDLDTTLPEPLPNGIVDEAINPEEIPVAIHFRYTKDEEGALYYYLTYDGHYLKAFSHLGMALAGFTAIRKTWKREYKRLLPQICHSYQTLLGANAEPTETQLDDILIHAMMKIKLNLKRR